MSDTTAYISRLGSYSDSIRVAYEYDRLIAKVGQKINDVYVTKISPYIKKYQNELEYFSFALSVVYPAAGTSAEFKIEIVMPYRYPQEQPVPRLLAPPAHEFTQTTLFEIKQTGAEKGNAAIYLPHFRADKGVLENLESFFVQLGNPPIFRTSAVYNDLEQMKREYDAMNRSFKDMGAKVLPEAITSCKEMTNLARSDAKPFNPGTDIAVTSDPKVVAAANALAIRTALVRAKDSLYSDDTPMFKAENLEYLLGLYEYLTLEELKSHNELSQLAGNLK